MLVNMIVEVAAEGSAIGDAGVGGECRGADKDRQVPGDGVDAVGDARLEDVGAGCGKRRVGERVRSCC